MNESVLHVPCDYQSLYNLSFHWSEFKREEILHILNFLTAILFFKKCYLRWPEINIYQRCGDPGLSVEIGI